MRDELEERGHTVNRKRVQRLMRQMGLRALYPRRRTSQPGKGHKIYPYLLRDLSIERANQAWASDISYIPMAGSCTRWRSWTGILDGAVMAGVEHPGCGLLYPLEEALQRFRRSSIPTKGPSSPVKRSPTCSRATPSRSAWTARADGWTTCSSSVWRSVKYEDVYLRAYETPTELRTGLARYFGFYNTKRRHSALDRRTPDAVYFDQAHRDLAA